MVDFGEGFGVDAVTAPCYERAVGVVLRSGRGGFGEEEIVRAGFGADEKFAAGFVESVEEGDEAAGFVLVEVGQDRHVGENESVEC